MASYQIYVQNLTIPCIVGVLAHERRREQPLLLSLKLTMKCSVKEYQTLESTVDYAELCQRLRKLIQQGCYYLLEVMANEIIEMVFSQYAHVQGIQLWLKKPQAMNTADAVGIIVKARR